MKSLVFTVIISLFTYYKNQPPNLFGYDSFLQYVRKGFKPSDATKKNCEWQYALVKVNTDINNKVIKYDLLNKTSEDLTKSLSFLLGYQFSKNLPINKHPIVFCISLENEKKDCMALKKQYSPSEVLGMVLSNLTPVYKSDPKAIFLPEVLMLSYSFDSIR
ncbi:hypothetical protein [Mucilaginibacter sp.]|uniref:hypothetical protein n=1 Tax=Mucilaginibacter sp. TaxID=1882438 RepID=UPI00263885A6|nr:hypothetical protein [Mucilaginibacter sp.]MDB4924731.1 hypothetical protein [Mucilaginibacter sp.]